MDDKASRGAERQDGPTLDILRSRVEGEFFEMPGLRLTLPQAGRLWGVDLERCERVLLTLEQAGFLARTRDGAFVRAA
jgi:hypothetical protein